MCSSDSDIIVVLYTIIAACIACGVVLYINSAYVLPYQKYNVFNKMSVNMVTIIILALKLKKLHNCQSLKALAEVILQYREES